jgi:purine nucleosidase
VSREPGIAKALKHLWVMGGTDNGIGNVTPAAEFNFYVDPEAAAIVFRAGFDITLVTWTLCLSAGLTEAELGAIERLGTPRAHFFTQVNSAAVAFSRRRYGHGATLHPDALTAALCLDEALILESEACRVEIETARGLTRAYSSVSSARLPPPEEADPALIGGSPNARVVKRVDREGFRDRMMRAMNFT